MRDNTLIFIALCSTVMMLFVINLRLANIAQAIYDGRSYKCREASDG